VFPVDPQAAALRRKPVFGGGALFPYRYGKRISGFFAEYRQGKT
jgi:hypothetical protein